MKRWAGGLTAAACLCVACGDDALLRPHSGVIEAAIPGGGDAGEGAASTPDTTDDEDCGVVGRPHSYPPHHAGHGMHGHDAGVDGGAQSDAGSGPPACAWHTYDEGLSGASIADVLIDPRAPLSVYAAAGANFYASTDGGKSFVLRGSLDNGTFVGLDAAGPEPGVIVAATSVGVAKSVDGGASWQRAGMGGVYLSAIAANLGEELTLYSAPKWSGVVRSDDSGDTWTSADFAVTAQSITALSVDPYDPRHAAASVVVQATPGGSLTGAVLVSDDGGTTWRTAYTARDWIGDVTRCLADPRVVLAPRDGSIAVSRDSGATWSTVPGPATGYLATISLAADDCDRFYVQYYDGGLFRTRDGGASFERASVDGLNAHPLGSYPSSISLDPVDSARLVAGTHTGVFVSEDEGDTWQTASGLRELHLSLSRGAGATGLFASGWGTGLWQRRDAAHPWERVATDLVPSDYVYFAASDPSAEGRTLVGIFGRGLTIFGDTLEASGLLSQYNPWTAVFDPRDARVVYVASQVGGVFKSTDGGRTFAPSNRGIEPFPTPNGTFIDVRQLVIDPEHPDTLFAGTYGRGLWRSDDGGATWENIYAPQSQVGCLLLAPGAAQRLTVCAEGVFASSDGRTFTSIAEGLPTLAVSGLAYASATETLYATTSEGVYAREGSGSFVPLDSAACAVAARSPVLLEDGTTRRLMVAGAGGVLAREL